MSCLFEPVEFDGISLRNRFVRSATMENLATSDRTPSKELVEVYQALADGGVGLIITSAVRPDRAWDPHPNSRGMCLDREAMSRPFIREPGLIRRWENGDLTPAACISCNGCMERFKDNRSVRCILKQT